MCALAYVREVQREHVTNTHAKVTLCTEESFCDVAAYTAIS